MTKKRLTTILGGLMGLGLLGVAASAAAYQHLDVFSATSWEYVSDVDFAKAWDSTGASGQKNVQLVGQIPSTTGNCFELETLNGTFANPDTRIWVFDGTNYRNLNDDFGGTLLTKGRLWLGPGVDYVTHVEAFSTAYNSMDFRLKVKRLDVTEAACTTGQATIPWAKQKLPGGVGNYGTVTFGNGAG